MALKTAYLSLGSNLGNREEYLRRAVELLESPGVQVKRLSSLYETEPQDIVDQPWFLNQVVEVETSLFPLQLLDRTQGIERQLGRQRIIDKGPRTLDIDILVFGSAVIRSQRLVIPHPSMAQRRFVLEPLAELAPGLRHPVTGASVEEMLAGTVRQNTRKLSF